MKLNLGCNTRIRPGYVNIDKDKYPGVDIVGDVSKLDMADNSASEVYASNILEHFPHTQTLSVLKEWYRLLKPEGILAISVPDFDEAMRVYKTNGLCDWVVKILWGDQGYDGAFHYRIFNEPSLTALLKQAGFKDISRVEQLPGSQKEECSNIRSTVTGRFICLNMVAVKI